MYLLCSLMQRSLPQLFRCQWYLFCHRLGWNIELPESNLTKSNYNTDNGSLRICFFYLSSHKPGTVLLMDLNPVSACLGYWLSLEQSPDLKHLHFLDIWVLYLEANSLLWVYKLGNINSLLTYQNMPTPLYPIL